jgi:ABC-2 type transport system ATP-binding protein
MLCGLLTPDSGEGTCLGYDIRRDADKIKRRVGYMTQRFSLYQDRCARTSSSWRGSMACATRRLRRAP